MWIRHVVVPGITDDPVYLEKLGYFIGAFKTLKALDILPYHDMGTVKYEKLGMEYDKALTLSIQTAIGSAKMLLNSDKSAEDLIASVATQGGCTRVGVDYMDEEDTKNLFYNLIDKTATKAKALGK